MSKDNSRNSVYDKTVEHNNSGPLQPDDFYFEGSFMVFTEKFLLRRGYCCGSGCRHCPYSKNDTV